MIDNRIIVRVQEDLAALIHESWVITDSLWLVFFNRFSSRIRLWYIISPYEERVRTIVAVWAPILMGLEEGRLPVW